MGNDNTLNQDLQDPTPAVEEILAQAAPLAPIPRFWKLLPYAKTLIREHGPYSTLPDTTVLTRASPDFPVTAKPPSAHLFATSFAAAQDAYNSAQPEGPAKQDLALFSALWKTSIQVVEHVLEEGIEDGETFGWGVYGLSFGYIPAIPSAPSSTNSRDSTQFDDEFFPRTEHKPLPTPRKTSKPRTAFDVLQQRLHAALMALPGVNNAQHENERDRSTVSPAERVGRLVKKRNEVHLCATLLMQRFSGEEWTSVRWGHLIAVVERWLSNLALAGAKQA